jgi:uncharacterized membrane protein YfcA
LQELLVFIHSIIMSFLQLFSDFSIYTLLLLAIFAFIAGFIDSVVGGGGLIQIPALLITLPGSPLPTIFGTNKIAALSGTSMAAYQYSKRVKFDYKLLAVVSISAFLASHAGAKAVSTINTHILKPVILVILVLIAIYTFIKKDMGTYQTKALSFNRQLMFGTIIGLVIGFYDGFFGPGTGSFFVLGFVIILGFEFITASAYSKVINCITNISALIVFIRQGNYLLGPAVLMAICNVAGSITGSKMALKKGNRFVRVFFLIIVTLMIVRYSWDIISGK